MARWNADAITDVACRRRFQREMTPAWLLTACSFLGAPAPASLSEPFRFADLGCGSGFHAAVVAATCPSAEVWGFDFNPANIELARDLAKKAGLDNLRFAEISFAELVERGAPEFNIMIAEALLNGLSPDDRTRLFSLIGKHLAPGGIACLGYHVDTGWTEFAPLRTMLRIRFEAGNDASDFVIPNLLAYLDRMREGGALHFQRNPVLERQIAALRRRSPIDLAHEFLGAHWHSLMFADVADAMAEAKCEFLGHAALHDNVAAGVVPAAMLPFLDDAPTIRLRETLRDLALATTYRRDVYRRGLNYLPVAEHRERLGAIAVTANVAGLEWPADGPRPHDPAPCQNLFDAARDGVLSVARAHEIAPWSEQDLTEAADAVAMLTASDRAHPVLPAPAAHAAAAPVARLNDAIIDATTRGEDIGYLVCSTTGSAIEADPLEILTVGALARGVTADDRDGLAENVMRAMHRGGRSVVRDGQNLRDAAEAMPILRAAIARIVETRVPLFRALGIAPA